MASISRNLIGLLLTATIASHALAQPVCEQQRIESNAPTSFYNFGRDVAIWGDTVVVGEPTISPFLAGSAHVFKYDEQMGWLQSQVLVAPDGAGGDSFGRAVELQQEFIVVGAPFQDHVDAQGAVYVWKVRNARWELDAKITPALLPSPAGAFGLLIGADRPTLFGVTVDRLYASASPGQVYIFIRVGDSWVLEQTINGPDLGVSSVGMDGDVLAVGHAFDWTHCNDPDDPADTGIVHVYRWNSGEWTHEQSLVPSNHECWRRFGSAVAVQGNRIVVTAPQSEANGVPSAYVFEYDEDSATWVEAAILTSPQSSISAFGRRARSAAVEGDTIIIGDDQSGQARAFVFQRRPDGTWIERDVLQPDSAPSSFGRSVRIHNGRAVISASSENMGAGEAYIYDLKPKPGDFDCDGVVGVTDLLFLLDSWGECPTTPHPGGTALPGCPADLTLDGHTGVPDLLLLLANWGGFE